MGSVTFKIVLPRFWAKLVATGDRLGISCESNLPSRGDHPVRLEQGARGVQKLDNEFDTRCSG